MQSTSQNFESIAGDMLATVAALRGQVAAMEPQWVGRGGASFQTVMANWDRAAATMNTALTETAQLIRNGGNLYTTTDGDSANRLANTGALPALPL